VFLAPGAIAKLLSKFSLEQHYAVTARGFDIFNGHDAPVGLWALNMRAIGTEHRFADVYTMDVDFSNRVEAATGLTRSKTKRGDDLAYHHPIWTPKELFTKFRYNAAKYKTKVIARYQAFFTHALAKNPGNKALLAGQLALKRGAAGGMVSGAPNRQLFQTEWDDAAELLDIKGGEYFAYHADFVALGAKLLSAEQNLVPMAPTFFGPDGNVLGGASELKQVVGGKNLTHSILLQVMRTAKDLVRPMYRNSPLFVKDAVARYRKLPPASPAGRIAEAKATQQYLHGSITPGIQAWEQRWEVAAKAKRILMVAPKDFAGSMFKWAEALNRHTDYAVRLITFEEHQYGYPLDLVVPECDPQRSAALQALASQAGIFHLKDEHSWFIGERQFTNLPLLNDLFFSPKFAATPKAFTHYGGYARRFKQDPAYIEAVRRFDLRVAMTPDLNFEWFDGEYIPHTIDETLNQFTWQDKGIFAHSPSSPEKKGTYLLEEAVLILQSRYPEIWRNWSLDLIHGVPFHECIARKKLASLFFDQAGRHRVSALGIDDVIGWYGNSAIEAMVFGIPTMAHLSESALLGAERAGVDMRNTPVINIEPTRDSLLKAFLDFARSSAENRYALATRTREFARSFHGYEAVGNRLATCYERLLSQDRIPERLKSV
jgi:hypothetical protein